MERLFFKHSKHLITLLNKFQQCYDNYTCVAYKLRNKQKKSFRHVFLDEKSKTEMSSKEIGRVDWL